jgi:hypothetical protein
MSAQALSCSIIHCDVTPCIAAGRPEVVDQPEIKMLTTIQVIKTVTLITARSLQCKFADSSDRLPHHYACHSIVVRNAVSGLRQLDISPGQIEFFCVHRCLELQISALALQGYCFQLAKNSRPDSAPNPSWVDIYSPEFVLRRNDGAEAHNSRLMFGNVHQLATTSDHLAKSLIPGLGERP